MGVVRYNFGMEGRRIARRSASLLGLNALHEANVSSNPLPYLERAGERIYQLEKVLFEAVDAATLRPGQLTSPAWKSTSRITRVFWHAALLSKTDSRN
jgi:hypothetical protein